MVEERGKPRRDVQAPKGSSHPHVRVQVRLMLEGYFKPSADLHRCGMGSRACLHMWTAQKLHVKLASAMPHGPLGREVRLHRG
mmetsp:Transcript_29938/g.91867  ORF Transcript_29938/g.91867 Transcript_29938/m.91867 type:complete len:83 (+) Transcript_29938:143-391(+)